MQKKIVIIGGGAAGFFAAATLAEKAPGFEVILLEKTQSPLAKVRISGGGRCNVTHSCFDPAALVQNYPRGQRALRGPFSYFQPVDIVGWFEERGVKLKTEEDGRIFPVTDSSETIISCLMHQIQKGGVFFQKGSEVISIEKKGTGFLIGLAQKEPIFSDAIILATGSNHKGHALASSLGHTITPCVPSLFTFVIKHPVLEGLSGISVPQATLSLEGSSLEQTGPLLITHLGLSGPAVLKLSAWGARFLNERSYISILKVSWIKEKEGEALELLHKAKSKEGKVQVFNAPLFGLPKNLWRRFLQESSIDPDKVFAQLSKEEMGALASILTHSTFKIEGKNTNKEEFVTCGGVSLDEVNFKTMESKLCPHLYFAGEVLDIDGVTGGFNFQNAWTTAYLAASAISSD